MEFKTEEELIEMGKCQLIRLVLDLQNEIKLLEYAIKDNNANPVNNRVGSLLFLPFSYLLLLRGSNSATPEVLFYIYFQKNLKKCLTKNSI